MILLFGLLTLFLQMKILGAVFLIGTAIAGILSKHGIDCKISYVTFSLPCISAEMSIACGCRCSGDSCSFAVSPADSTLFLYVS